MEAESFFARWSRRNAEAAADKQAAEPAPATQPEPPAEEMPPPTLEDVAQLTPDSDFKPFVARGVDENIRRSAMKKLFADPHFNVMDGLDIYIDDYNKFEPIPAAMLAMLNHAQPLLNPLAQLTSPLMQLIDAVDEKDGPAPQLTQEPPAEQQPREPEDSGAAPLPPETPTTTPTLTHDDPV